MLRLDDTRIKFFEIYYAIYHGEKTSKKRAEIFMTDGVTDGTGVTNVIKEIRAKLTMAYDAPRNLDHPF